VDHTRLFEVLERSRGLGFLGPGSVRVHVDHATGFADGVDAPGRFLDLGSGGGVPGLVLAQHWRRSGVVLLDSRERRCDFLAEAVRTLDLADRVVVECVRAEEAGHRGDLRGQFDLVTARAFGPPPVTAECGAPFLRVGGTLVVSEPPQGDAELGAAEGGAERWPSGGLARLGLAAGRSWVGTYRYQALELVAPCPPQYPRPVGTPGKRPLF